MGRNYYKIKFKKDVFVNFIFLTYLEKEEMRMHTTFLVRVSEDKRPLGILGGKYVMGWVEQTDDKGFC
jgi:hypothetical protein